MNNIQKITILLFTILPIIFNPFGFDVFALPRVFFLYLICLILLFLMLFQAIKSKKLKIKYSNFHLILALFFFFICLSVVLSQDKYTAIWGYVWDYEGLFSWVCYFILFQVGFVYFRQKKDFNKLITVISFPLMLVGIYAILQYFFDWKIMDWHQATEIKRATSFLGHPSYLGCYFILYLPLIFYLILDKKNNSILKSFLIISFFFGAFGLVLSFSRGAWLAFIFLVVLLFVFYWRNILLKIRSQNRKNIIIFGSLFLIILFFGLIKLDVFNIVYERFLSIFDPESSTFKVRKYLYEQSLYLLENNWLFGIGPDNFAYAISQYFTKNWELFREVTANKAHNQILDYWISFGVGGFLSYVLFLYFWFKKVIQSYKKTTDEKKIILAICFSIIGYLITLQFHYSTIDLAPFFWFLLGAGAGFIVSLNEIEEKVIKFYFNKKIIYSVFFIFLVFLSKAAYTKISADYLFSQAIKHNNDDSIILLEHAINKNSRVANYYLTLNNFYLQKGDYYEDQTYYQKAVDNLISAYKAIPNDYQITFALGNVYLKILDYAENKKYIYAQAQNAFLKTLELYPNFAQAHLKAGVVAINLGKYEQAEIHWLKCIELGRYKSESYYNLYALHHQYGNKEFADYYYKKFLDLQ